MELWEEILLSWLLRNPALFQQGMIDISPKELLELSCYRALCRIRQILMDESLKDQECFGQIEEIVCLFEELGSDCGTHTTFDRYKMPGLHIARKRVLSQNKRGSTLCPCIYLLKT